MASIIRAVVQEYEEYLPYADPRTKSWLLLQDTPIYVWILTASYLTFVFVGPKLMQNRKPFDLKGFMLVYNLGLVGLSAYMFYEMISSTWNAGYSYIGCIAYNEDTIKDPREMRVAVVLWWYFFSKVIELMDTVLMILRKKNNQVTFLHVFHHAAMLNIWWWVTTFIPGGLSFFGACLNCLVHIVMYSYYGLSVIPALKGKLWWKYYITQFQLIQFCITLSHTLYSMSQPCRFPRWGQNLLAGFMIVMLILFSNFYIRSYILSKKKRSEKSHENGSTNGTVISGMPEANGYVIEKKKRKNAKYY